jgi:hypothetical protein
MDGNRFENLVASKCTLNGIFAFVSTHQLVLGLLGGIGLISLFSIQFLSIRKAYASVRDINRQLRISNKYGNEPNQTYMS